VADLSTLSAHRVRDLPYGNQSMSGGGYFARPAVAPLPERVEIYSLRDGSRRDFIPTWGEALPWPPVYVMEHDLLILAAGGGFYRIDPALQPIVPGG